MSEIHGKESITQFLLLRVLLKTLKKPPPFLTTLSAEVEVTN